MGNDRGGKRKKEDGRREKEKSDCRMKLRSACDRKKIMSLSASLPIAGMANEEQFPRTLLIGRRSKFGVLHICDRRRGRGRRKMLEIMFVDHSVLAREVEDGQENK